MINPEEIRVGNWVLNNHQQYFKISSGSDLKQVAGYSPIPLTPQLLIHAGFDQLLWVDKFKIPVSLQLDLIILKRRDGWLASLNQWEQIDADFIAENLTSKEPLYYLHQLQNLYYKLADQELNIIF